MRDYIIFTDSGADLSDSMVKEWGVEIIPILFLFGTQSFEGWPDEREITFKEFYRRLREGETSSTSQVNITDYIEYFTPYLAQGKDILYIGLSSGLSGTLNSARLAVEELSVKHPEASIKAIDSLGASLGQGMLVWHAVQMKKQGKPLAEIAGWLEENLLKAAMWFTVDDLNFLRRGGRLSAGAAILGGMLNIKPVLHVDNAGKLIPMEKVRGRKASFTALLDHMEKTGVDIAGQTIFLSHGDCLEDAEGIAAEIRSRFGVKEVMLSYIGPVVGSHSGPGTIALFYMGTHRD